LSIEIRRASREILLIFHRHRRRTTAGSRIESPSAPRGAELPLRPPLPLGAETLPLLRRVAERLQRRQDDNRAARSPHSSLRHRRDRQRILAFQEPRLISMSPGRASLRGHFATRAPPTAPPPKGSLLQADLGECSTPIDSAIPVASCPGLARPRNRMLVCNEQGGPRNLKVCLRPILLSGPPRRRER